MALKNFPCHHTHGHYYYQVLFKIEIHMPHTIWQSTIHTIVKSSRTLVDFTLTKLFVKLIVEISNNYFFEKKLFFCGRKIKNILKFSFYFFNMENFKIN
jgi:hypothetical protein